MLAFARPRQGMAQSSCAEGPVTPSVDIGADKHGHDFEGSSGLQHFCLHAKRGLCQDFSPPLPKSSAQMVPSRTAGSGWMMSGTLHFWLTSMGARGCLVILAMPVTRASLAEGAGSSTAALPSRTKPHPQAEPGPSTQAGTGCHPTPAGGRRLSGQD